MRFINLIVVHCSATRCDRCYTEHDLTTDHLRRGFSGAGYHFYIRKNGDIKSLRPLSLPGAHVRGWNAGSIGVCYEGGPFSIALPACACVAAAEGLSRFPALRSPRPEPRPEP